MRGESSGLTSGSEFIAAASQEQPDADRPACFLHTDLATPSSHGIYQRIGYELVCESVMLAFG